MDFMEICREDEDKTRLETGIQLLPSRVASSFARVLAAKNAIFFTKFYT